MKEKEFYWQPEQNYGVGRKRKKITYIENEKDCWICNYVPNNGYPKIKIEGKTIKLSRILLSLKLRRPIKKGIKLTIFVTIRYV